MIFALTPKTARRLALSALAIYWLALFAGTHLPQVPHVRVFSLTDKAVHFIAYTGLGFLAILALGVTGRLRWRVLPLVLLGLAAFGAFDELTQPLVGRTADWLDWYADVAGAALGIALGMLAVWWLGWRPAKRDVFPLKPAALESMRP